MRLNLSVGQRLALAFGVLIVLALFASGMGLAQVRSVEQATNTTRESAAQLSLLSDLEVAWSDVVSTVDQMLLNQQVGLVEAQLYTDLEGFGQRLNELEAEAAMAGQEETLASLQKVGPSLRRQARVLATLAQEGDWPTAQAIRDDELATLQRRFRSDLWALKADAQRDFRASVERVERIQRNARWYWRLAALGAVVFASLAGYLATKSITQPIGALVDAAEAVQEGDLSRRVEVRRQDEIGLLARTLNETSAQLQQMLNELEQRVAERTRELEENLFELEGAAQVARQAASIRDVDQLMEETVHLMSVLLGFYHVGIFIVDEEGEYAVLQTASSQGGRRMVERGHRLKVGAEGIVGDVAASETTRVALDVGEDAVHFANPDLPDTRSEMAVPLEVRGKVIGVLDVQSMEKEAFSDQDVAIIKTLADQIALAIENARLLQESERTVRELERLYGQRMREAWREQVIRRPAYRYTGVGVEPVSAPQAPEVALPEDVGEPRVMEAEKDGRQLSAPIRLRGQKIGSIVLRQDPDEEPWSEEEVALMDEISDQIALALENARLLEETQRRAARERLVGEITTRMRESLDVEAVLQTAAREMRTALDLEEAEVRIMPSALEDDER